MEITSLAFLALLPLLFVLEFLPNRNLRWQNLVLLVASYLFYATWDYRAVPFLFFLTLINYLGARYLISVPANRKHWVLRGAVGIDLLSLMIFRVLIPLDLLRVADNFIMVIGLSFYVFQNIGYLIDVDHVRIKPVSSFLDYLLFSSYFPIILSGPIERGRHLIPQLQKVRFASAANVEKGMQLIVLGLFKKVVLATIALSWYLPVFQNPGRYGSFQVAIAIYLYAIQLYTDFSGYTDIVRGVSYLFSIELFENFRQPYLSTSVTEFWQRWHMSLSNWVRDFVFFPLSRRLLRLSKNRYTGLVRSASLMTTMVIMGLWHGISLKYITWGGLQGLYLALHFNSPDPAKSRLKLILATVLTFHLILFSWIFFGESQFAKAIQLLLQLRNFSLAPHSLDGLPILILLYVIMFGIDIIQRLSTGRYLSISFKGVCLGLAIIAIIIFSAMPTPFVYSQF